MRRWRGERLTAGFATDRARFVTWTNLLQLLLLSNWLQSSPIWQRQSNTLMCRQTDTIKQQVRLVKFTVNFKKYCSCEKCHKKLPGHGRRCCSILQFLNKLAMQIIANCSSMFNVAAADRVQRIPTVHTVCQICICVFYGKIPKKKKKKGFYPKLTYLCSIFKQFSPSSSLKMLDLRVKERKMRLISVWCAQMRTSTNITSSQHYRA